MANALQRKNNIVCEYCPVLAEVTVDPASSDDLKKKLLAQPQGNLESVPISAAEPRGHFPSVSDSHIVTVCVYVCVC